MGCVCSCLPCDKQHVSNQSAIPPEERPLLSSEETSTTFPEQMFIIPPEEKYVYTPLKNKRGFRVFTLNPAPYHNSALTGSLSEFELPILPDSHETPETDISESKRDSGISDRQAPAWYERWASLAGRYEALSYVWGAREGTLPLVIDSKRVLITPNCDSALRHLRLPDRPRRLWVDSICIDQASTLEKNQQVALMGDIFGITDKLIIWLGASPYEKPGERYSAEPPSLSPQDIIKCLQSTWFRRMWTLQEQILNANLHTTIMKWGPREASWDDYNFLMMKHIQGLVDSSTRSPRTDQTDQFRPLSLPFDRISIGAGVRRTTRDSPAMQRRSVYAMLYSCCNLMDATMEVDRMYSVRSLLLDIGMACPEVDYNLPAEEVYAAFIRTAVVHEKSLWPLLCSSPTRTSGASGEPLPSWIPDPRKTDDIKQAQLMRNKMLLCSDIRATRGESIDEELLETWRSGEPKLKGRIVAEIDWAFPFSARENILQFSDLDSLHRYIHNHLSRLLALANTMQSASQLEELIYAAVGADEPAGTSRSLGTPRDSGELYDLRFILPALQRFAEECSRENNLGRIAMDKFLEEDQGASSLDFAILEYKGSVFFTTAAAGEGKPSSMGVIAGSMPPIYLRDKAASAPRRYYVGLFCGADVPVIVSPEEDGRYKLIGPAYVLGLMDGKAWKREVEAGDLDTITLC